MNSENSKKIILISIPIIFVIFELLILLDLEFIDLKSWPYVSGGGIDKIWLAESFFSTI